VECSLTGVAQRSRGLVSQTGRYDHQKIFDIELEKWNYIDCCMDVNSFYQFQKLICYGSPTNQIHIRIGYSIVLLYLSSVLLKMQCSLTEGVGCTPLINDINSF
jgi:hypothetical protein